ncbi:CRISPR-associated endonuclease Cas1 [Thaumarchaeota archaeon SCGC AB-539-E09]|nr:CRISPR-associated endonuclease Cas1 [Thaumarchaeota archaeon SCGC AB-539-E09]
MISSGNNVSSSALFWLAQYGVETAIVSKTGKLVATIVPASYEARSETRLKQYEAFFNRKGVEVAQDFARARVESEISFMEEHELNASRLEEWLPRINFVGDRVDEVRVKIQGFEGRCTQEYLKQYFNLFPDFLKTRRRHQKDARDPLNNLMNLGYEVLKRRVYVATTAAHLDPYIGYLHSVQFGKSSMVCDLMEPWRAMIESFILNYHTELDPNCFTMHGNRSFLKHEPMINFTKALDKHIDNKRIPYSYRDNSKTTRIRTAIKEEPKKLATYLRTKSP